jgi:hypothetical protein
MAETVIQQVVPGPCPPEGCPPPTEIVCIQTNKVYDFCFQQDIASAPCLTIPVTVTVPTGSTATCAVTNVVCQAGVPVPTGVDGLATVSVVVTITYDVTVFSPTGAVVTTLTDNTFVFTKSVIVCGPVGTTAECEATASCSCIVIPGPNNLGGQVCCSFNICLLVQTVAAVKLLIPAYGFCTPAPCRTGGFPPCPPFPLFPPQCELTVGG